MGLGNHQAIGFLHEDKKHTHLHLIINRINENDFSLYNDSFVGKKSSKAADEIAIELGLTRASQIGREKLRMQQDGTIKNQDLGTPNGAKQRFKADLERILQQGHVDLEAYFKAVENDCYKVRKYIDKKTGKIRGYGVERDGTSMDASKIDRKLTISKLSFDGNKKIQEKEITTKPGPKIIEQQKNGGRRR